VVIVQYHCVTGGECTIKRSADDAWSFGKPGNGITTELVGSTLKKKTSGVCVVTQSAALKLVPELLTGVHKGKTMCQEGVNPSFFFRATNEERRSAPGKRQTPHRHTFSLHPKGHVQRLYTNHSSSLAEPEPMPSICIVMKVVFAVRQCLKV
jgi:hypothetical protein